ncbi:ABC transporter ATP-binding protein [soil metagenome]
MTSAVVVDGVSKRFRLSHNRHSSLKERVIHFGRRRPPEEFWALRDVGFEVAEGETMGLLGHNGSGKSTLLKCVAGILQPTSGEIVTRGRVASLLELGAGFHPDLTGRENVFLNAQILGLKNRDIQRRFDEIVAFAELEQFIDQQVKHYSSGMYIRLGFAVATNVDPDLLLVDEVLSVGDESFQRKCIERVRQFQNDGRTIVFVTHAADLVRQLCDRAVVLHHGEVVDIGPPGEAIRSFRERLMADGGGPGTLVEEDEEAADGERPARPSTTRAVRIAECRVASPALVDRSYLLPGEPVQVHVRYEAAMPVDDVVFAINIHDEQGRLLYGANTDLLGNGPDHVEGEGWVTFSFSSVPLFDGTYLISIGIHSHDLGTIYDQLDTEHQFEVMNPTRLVGLVAFDAKVTTEGPP